jgi:regulatory protein
VKQATRPARRKSRKPRKATPKSIENWALHHLARYDCSAAHLSRLLMRRVRRSAHYHGTDGEEGARAVRDVIEKLSGNGMLDDARHARARAASLNRRGASLRAIRGKLREKGIADDLIEQAVDTLGGKEQAEMRAALALARRRRLGPFRAQGAREASREKDLAALARAGFGYGLAQRIIDARSHEELEPDNLI